MYVAILFNIYYQYYQYLIFITNITNVFRSITTTQHNTSSKAGGIVALQLLHGMVGVPEHHTAPFVLAEVPEGFEEVDMPKFAVHYMFGGHTHEKLTEVEGAVGYKWVSGGEVVMHRSLVICGGLEFEPVRDLTAEVIDGMNVGPLKDELQARGKSIIGIKSALAARLKEVAQSEGRVRAFKARKLTAPSRARLLSGSVPRPLLGLF